MVNKPIINEPTFNGSGVISIAEAAKFLRCHRTKITTLLNTKFFGATKGRNGGRLLSFKKVVELRDMITNPQFPANAPLKHKNMLIKLFKPEEDILCQ